MIELQIQDLKEAGVLLVSSKVDALVSIGTPGTVLPEGFQNAPYRLRLEMDDIYNIKDLHSSRSRGERPPCRGDVDMIVEFAGGLVGDERLLVHCWAGRSRSPAAAWIILYILNGPGSEKATLEHVLRVRPQSWPNKILMAYADGRLGSKFLDAMNTDTGGIWLP